MELIQDKPNELFNRREIKMIVQSGKNLSFPETEKIISEHFKVSPDCIVIKKIKGKFGRDTFLISANIYKNEEDKIEIEGRKSVKEQAGKEKAGEGEKQADKIQAEEKPAEEEEKIQTENKNKPAENKLKNSE